MTNQTLKIGVAYIRESTEEQDKGFSPKNQENYILDYAKRNQIQIVEIYKDLVSGKSVKNRSDFQRMIADAKRKKFEAVIVYHTSRFARNVREAREHKDELRRKYKIDVISATQPFGDWNNPSSFLNEGVNELFDEHYSRQLSFWMKGALEEKRRQGKPCGNPPLGYYKKQIGFDKDKKLPIYDKKWLVDKKSEALVKRIFDLYATGNNSMATIASILTKEGKITNYGNQFTYDSIRTILTNKIYIGKLNSPRKDLPDVDSTIHQGIIDIDVFDKVQKLLKERGRRFGRPLAQHRDYMLQGLVFCHHCMRHIEGKEENVNARMTPKMYCHTSITKKKKEIQRYICKFSKENKSCDESVSSKIIDRQVRELMGGFIFNQELIAATLKELKVLIKDAKNDDKNGASNQTLEQLELKKEKLNHIYLNSQAMSLEAYTAELNKINESINRSKVTSATASFNQNSNAQIIKQTEYFLNNFSIYWKNTANKKDVKAWVNMIAKRIWVKNKAVHSIEPKEEFKALFISTKEVIGQAPVATLQSDIFKTPPFRGSFVILHTRLR
jgi:DNA invertase Pin-like site-specific DNA recombinase